MACRMFGYCGKMESDLRELYASLKQACASDPTLNSIAPGCSSHSHGWGYVIQADNGLFHYRTGRSIYEDQVELPRLFGRIRAIFHGRYASKPELTAPIFSHPYMASDSARITFLAHNGGVDVKGLPARKVDSEWVLDQLVEAGDVEPALPKLRKYTGSALNLLILTISRQVGTPAMLRYFHYFNPDKPRDYYGMFEGEMPGGRALVSSTLTLPSAKLTSIQKVKPAVFDQVVSLEQKE